MAVFAAEGRFGSGKTAYAVWLARELSRRRNGCPIWANFSMVGSRPIYTIAELYGCEDGVIVIDELQLTIHARLSSGAANLEFLKWFDQVRKQNSDFIVMTQALHKIDVIVREMLDIGFICENRGPIFSRLEAIDMHDGKVMSSFRFDRSQSFGYYDHRERAWGLKGEDKKATDRNRARDGP
jgi:hypothetical protein